MEATLQPSPLSELTHSMASTSSFTSNTTGLSASEFDVAPTPYASPLHPANIFNVEGLVAVITGGGTGKHFLRAFVSPVMGNDQGCELKVVF